MPAAIHLTVPAERAPRDTRHTCPFPGCRMNLPASKPACSKHRKAWRAARDAAAAGNGEVQS